MNPFIKAATAADQSDIIALVRAERLNPTNLDWRRFTVAVHDQKVIGAVQIRRHRDGALELGSLVVARAFRNQGVAAALIDKALAPVPDTVWMITRRAHADHYAAWDFALADVKSAPGSVRFNYRIGRAARVISWFKGLEPTNLTLLVSKARSRSSTPTNP
jgi:amino-acid N-acetyltransferase